MTGSQVVWCPPSVGDYKEGVTSIVEVVYTSTTVLVCSEFNGDVKLIFANLN